MIPKPLHICQFRIYERKNMGADGQPAQFQICGLFLHSYIHIYSLYLLIAVLWHQFEHLYFDLILPTQSICIPNRGQRPIPPNIREVLALSGEYKRLSHIQAHKPSGFADEKEPT